MGYRSWTEVLWKEGVEELGEMHCYCVVGAFRRNKRMGYDERGRGNVMRRGLRIYRKCILFVEGGFLLKCGVQKFG